MSSAQSLTLSVQGERGERLGARREHEFDCRDGSIGRSDECDWVLGAEGVSRLHALVRYLNGLYFIEDRSTNGMLLNGTSLTRGEPAALKHGDRLHIDTFEIGVRLKGEAATQWNALDNRGSAAASTAPGHADALSAPAKVSAKPIDTLDLSLLLAPRRDAAPGSAGHGEGLIPGAADAAPGASLDPLAMFDPPSSYADEAQQPPPPVEGWNHTPAVSDRFRPPQVEAARPSGPILPDDWDTTGSRVVSRVGPKEIDSLPVPDAATPGALPVSPPDTTASGSSAKAPPQPALEQTPANPAAQEPSPQPLPQKPTPPPEPAPAFAAAHALTPEPAHAATAPTSSAVPELNDMFHIAVDAMMDVLRARAELKNSFRLPATLIQRSENNPLKFAPTAQEAVKKLFAPPDQGFLSGSAALNDAAADIRNHQMAMLAGVRSAFQSMLAHFDPARIEDAASGGARRLSLGSRPRHWERYKEQFDALTRNPDECFRRLFGDEFARAYEEQLARLKSRRD
ncbi:hypothetical protein LMG28727_05336 [Paraburkholderia kirstenboschensis]|uniref:type VI secretion system-associated FHA domain protein TagH n=1 Tax=Paraburkholderia kirstenboschensis TaxID=1245436 RepID=UPI000AD0CD24|nr:type VI secretion system-associated FHA domain protein TagH [Paraburkholderia kirstenboschensis]CAD6552083.1 hypothetical protein LMG28727_05336 [Paraburkholderia kirstenboschensis]